MEDPTGRPMATAATDDLRDPRVVMFERLLDETHALLITSEADGGNFFGVAITHDNKEVHARADFAMELVENLIEKLDGKNHE